MGVSRDLAFMLFMCFMVENPCPVHRVSHLVSWNFKHLVNIEREKGFNAVNLLQGYPAVRIVAPTFLIHGHEEKGH